MGTEKTRPDFGRKINCCPIGNRAAAGRLTSLLAFIKYWQAGYCMCAGCVTQFFRSVPFRFRRKCTFSGGLRQAVKICESGNRSHDVMRSFCCTLNVFILSRLNNILFTSSENNSGCWMIANVEFERHDKNVSHFMLRRWRKMPRHKK